MAVAGFVGYILQSNGFYFPWSLTGTTTFADVAAAGSPPDQWDALPTAAKVQILCFIGAHSPSGAPACAAGSQCRHLCHTLVHCAGRMHASCTRAAP